MNQGVDGPQCLRIRAFVSKTPRSATCWRASTAKPFRLKKRSAPRLTSANSWLMPVVPASQFRHRGMEDGAKGGLVAGAKVADGGLHAEMWLLKKVSKTVIFQEAGRRLGNQVKCNVM